jgi:hypothetical protein
MPQSVLRLVSALRGNRGGQIGARKDENVPRKSSAENASAASRRVVLYDVWPLFRSQQWFESSSLPGNPLVTLWSPLGLSLFLG